MEVRTTLVGERTKDEVFSELEVIFERHKDLTARQINVSVSLHQKGVSGRYRDVPIAEDSRLYLHDEIIVFFDDEA